MQKLYKKYRELWGNETEMIILQREIIDSKPALQAMYKSFYSEVERFIPKNGLNIEIGTGHGYSRSFFKNIVLSDIILTPYIDMHIDAQTLPFRDKTLDTIISFGAFHHIKAPHEFLKEAQRVLKSEGRIIMVEPYVSLFSYPILKLLGTEKLDLQVAGCKIGKYHLIEANVAIPTIFFKKERKKFEDLYPDLKIIYQSYHTVFLFFATGGYSYPNILPNRILPVLLWIERKLKPFGKWLGSMMTVVIEKD